MEGANPSIVPDSQPNTVSFDDEILRTRQQSLFLPIPGPLAREILIERSPRPIPPPRDPHSRSFDVSKLAEPAQPRESEITHLTARRLAGETHR